MDILQRVREARQKREEFLANWEKEKEVLRKRYEVELDQSREERRVEVRSFTHTQNKQPRSATVKFS
jgi:hypothetical protein